MLPKKTLRQREQELRSLLATPSGVEDLQKLESTYASKSDSVRAERTSIITYLLIYEREHGLITT